MTAQLTHRSTVKHTQIKYSTVTPLQLLFNRINKHCNTEQAKQTERRYLHSTFMKNSYPRNFINKVLTKIRNKQRINKPNEQPTEQSKRTVTLPYINGTSAMTSRLLRLFNIDVAHKPTHKLRS